MEFTDSDYLDSNLEMSEDEIKDKSVQRIFGGLNPRQVEAVECLEGPLLIMAGAGSGKTRVLTCRIANLIEHGISPWNILAITFTNKAANEMKTRAEKMIGTRAKSVWLSTFHSFCARLLRVEIDHVANYDRNFVIYSGGDSKTLIRECIKELNLDDKKFMDSQIQGRISMAKNMLMDSKKYKEAVILEGQKGGYEWQIANIYEIYEKRLKDLNAMDFDDLLMVTVNLFENDSEVLEKYQEKYKYILVDEYQDTNEAQYKLMKLLADRYQNVCVVGDADQSIYGWRGADMKNILKFEYDYPNATTIKLEQNYRSTKVILDAANAVIKHNRIRKEKNLWTENDEGEKITTFEALTGFFEAAKIVHEIGKLYKEGFKYRDIALLYRINSQSRLLEEAFMKAGIPYVIVGGLKFYDRMEIKNTLAYLRLIYNSKDDMSLRRIINVPRRGIGATTLGKLQDFAIANDRSIFEVISNDNLLLNVDVSAKIKNNLREFAAMIIHFKEMQHEMSIDNFIRYVLENTGYMITLKTGTTPEDESRIENIEEFINVAKEFVAHEVEESKRDNERTSRKPEEITLEEFLNHISLISDLDVIEEEDRVSLMTVHSAKGLEFPIVFITGMEEGLFPHSKSISESEKLEEERRACYVAITRAQKKLYITFADSRAAFGGDSKASQKSRFLEEIPRKYLDIYEQRGSLLSSNPTFVHILPRSAQENSTKINSSSRSKFDFLTSLKSSTSKQQYKPNDQSKFKETKTSSANPNKTANLSKDWKLGDRVHHKKWGDGIVVKVLNSELEVKFLESGIGIKKLALQYAPITKVIE